MNPGVITGLVLAVVGVVGAVIGQFVVRHDKDHRSPDVRASMLFSTTIVEVASVLAAAIVVARAQHTLSIVIALAWLAAWTYITASEWRRFVRDRPNR